MAVAAIVMAWPTMSADLVTGPIEAEVVRVVDGDTIAVTANIWIGVSVASHVRIRGIDTPEMRGACPEEKVLAAAARDRLAELAGGAVRLTRIENDKYGGRVLADVAAVDGTDLATAMIDQGYARPYDGKARDAWCAVAGVRG